MGANLLCHGQTFSGSIPVLCKLLSYTHLWNEIRVKGGAYGCGLNAGVTGDLVFYTYRDPQPDRSLKVLEEEAFTGTVMKAMAAGVARAEEMGR